MMAANYPHIGDLENRLGRHYSRFSTSEPTAPLAAQSLARRKSRYGGSNRRSRASTSGNGRRSSDLGLAPVLRSVHTAGVARILFLIGSVRCLSRLACRRGASGERQDGEERGKSSSPVHLFLRQTGRWRENDRAATGGASV